MSADSLRKRLCRCATVMSALCAGLSCGGTVVGAHGDGGDVTVDAAVADVTTAPDASLSEDSASPDSNVRTDSAAGDSGAEDSGADASSQAMDSGADGPTDAGLCTPGATQCAGSTVETCGANQRWNPGVPCSQPTPDCAGGVCTCMETMCPGACVNLQTDNANCGGCGLACSTACTAGECIVALSSTAWEPVDLALDSTSVYWVGAGGVMKAQLDGGNPVTLSTIDGISTTVDSQRIYWTSLNLGDVLSEPLGGGSVSTLAPIMTIFPPGSIAVDSTSVYWVINAAALQAPLTGGAAVTFSSADVQDLVTAHGRVFLTDFTGVLSVDADGGATTLASDPGPSESGTTGIAVDATSAYWTTRATGTVMSVPISGGTPVTLATGQNTPTSIAVDAANVYWANTPGNAASAIVRAPIGGGAPVTLLSGLPSVLDLAVDSTSLYWVGGPSLMKMTPK